MFLGLMAPGSNSVFDTSFIAALANPIIAKSYIVSMNLRLRVLRLVLQEGIATHNDLAGPNMLMFPPARCVTGGLLNHWKMLLTTVAAVTVACCLQGSATNVPANNMTSIGHMAALHFLQEYGTLPRWLPKVYNNRQK